MQERVCESQFFGGLYKLRARALHQGIEVASVINSSNWNDPEQCKGFDKSCGQREIEHTHKVFFRRILFWGLGWDFNLKIK